MLVLIDSLIGLISKPGKTREDAGKNNKIVDELKELNATMKEMNDGIQAALKKEWDLRSTALSWWKVW